jgi:hypothetical protein
MSPSIENSDHNCNIESLIAKFNYLLLKISMENSLSSGNQDVHASSYMITDLMFGQVTLNWKRSQQRSAPKRGHLASSIIVMRFRH